MNILYITANDISAPNGPGVNEREFWLALQDQPGIVMGVFVKPAHQLSGVKEDAVRYAAFSASNKYFGTFIRQLGILVTLFKLKREGVLKEGRWAIVCRLPLLPWSIQLIFFLFKGVPLYVKTLGDMEFMRRKKGTKKIIYSIPAALQSWMVRFIIKRCQGVDVCTPELKKLAVETYKRDAEDIIVVPNATSAIRFSPHNKAESYKGLVIPQDSLVIGYVGGSPANRGGVQIIEICRRLNSEKGLSRRVKGLVVGGDTEYLSELAKQSEVDDDVWLLGTVPYEDVPSYIGLFDIGIAFDNPERAAIVGNSNQKVRQYLATGIPVITNDYSDSTLQRSAVVYAVGSDDFDSMCSAVREIVSLSEGREYAYKEEATRLFSDNFSIEITLSQRMKFWEKKYPS